MGELVKKNSILYVLIFLNFVSLFLPATLKPNSQTFQLDEVNFFEIITTNFSSFLLIFISILIIVLSCFYFKNLTKFFYGILIGSYFQFIISYINWSYLGNSFFSVYLYGFWISFILSIVTFILLFHVFND